MALKRVKQPAAAAAAVVGVFDSHRHERHAVAVPL